MPNTPTASKADDDLSEKVLAWTRYRVTLDVLDLICEHIGEQERNMLSYLIHDVLVGQFDERDWKRVLDHVDTYRQVVALQASLMPNEC